jgi:hypothetical protein
VLIGETFGGTRLDLDHEDGLTAVRRWGADVIVAEAFDTVGPFVAAHLGVPWHQAGLGPGIEAEVRQWITRAAARCPRPVR